MPMSAMQVSLYLGVRVSMSAMQVSPFLPAMLVSYRLS